MILRLINEAVLCLDEGVAGKPGPDAANQVDLGSVMGFGFPPFRGGVLFYTEGLGAKEILVKLKALPAEHGARYAPSPGIAARAQSGQGFLQVS